MMMLCSGAASALPMSEAIWSDALMQYRTQRVANMPRLIEEHGHV